MLARRTVEVALSLLMFQYLCKMLSLGPLLVDVGGRYEVVGVISFGSGDTVLGCGDPNNGGVYADVASLIGWISQYVRDRDCEAS